MHAAFPRFTQELNQVMKLGADSKEAGAFLDWAGGKILANGMVVLLKLGFGYILQDSLFKNQSEKAMAFFNENFVIRDPNAEGGKRYYQGKFLIRTKEAGDDMNVWLRFCPKPEALFKEATLVPLAVIATEALSEEEADRLEKDPDRVDLVIRFKDVRSILGLIGRSEIDMTGLLLENVVQMSGNVGHLFKIGAIAKNIELSLGLGKTGSD